MILLVYDICTTSKDLEVTNLFISREPSTSEVNLVGKS